MNLFNSFFMGGFECADHINRSGNRVNLLKETQHDIRYFSDYEILSSLGIKTVREGICWSKVEKTPGVFDFSGVINRIKAADNFGIQLIWDLIHFGYPDGIYPSHPHFNHRFNSLCREFAIFHKNSTTNQLYVVPINEISFLSWYSGDNKGTVPFATNNGWDIKYHLCQAAIIGIQTLKKVDPDCIIVLVEPLVSIHKCPQEDYKDFELLNEHQYQAMDIISGRMCPELGGSEEFLDILGFNYYWNCQWSVDGQTLEWPEQTHKIRKPLSILLQSAYKRYRKPIFLSETGHFGTGRVEWMDEITQECEKAKKNGVDFNGICIYPVIDRPDWDNLLNYSQCGIWDLNPNGDRLPNLPYINCIKNAQEKFQQPIGIIDYVLTLLKQII